MRLTLTSHLWFIGWIGPIFSYINDDIRQNKNTRQRLGGPLSAGTHKLPRIKSPPLRGTVAAVYMN